MWIQINWRIGRPIPIDNYERFCIWLANFDAHSLFSSSSMNRSVRNSEFTVDLIYASTAIAESILSNKFILGINIVLRSLSGTFNLVS